MARPTLADLPAPPADKHGWPCSQPAVLFPHELALHVGSAGVSEGAPRHYLEADGTAGTMGVLPHRMVTPLRRLRQSLRSSLR